MEYLVSSATTAIFQLDSNLVEASPMSEYVSELIYASSKALLTGSELAFPTTLIMGVPKLDRMVLRYHNTICFAHNA